MHFLAPKMELLTVVGLKNEELVPASSSTFSATVKWEKPLFTQSNVTHYIYRTTKEIKGQIERRSIGLDSENITVSSFFVADSKLITFFLRIRPYLSLIVSIF